MLATMATDLLPAADVSNLVDLGAMSAPDRRHTAEALDGSLVRRVVDTVRSAGADTALEAAASLNRLLRHAPGAALKRADPELFGIWHGYGRVLQEAARRRDSASAESVLRMSNGRARLVFEQVARHQRDAGKPLPRRALVATAGDEATLSKILRALESADLIRRERDRREVLVHLGAAGHARLPSGSAPPIRNAEPRPPIEVTTVDGTRSVVIPVDSPRSRWAA